MKSYLISLFNQLQLNDYKDVFLAVYDKVVADKGANALLHCYLDDYSKDCFIDYKKMQFDLTELSKTLDIPYQTLCSVFVFCLSSNLEKVYKSKGINLEFMHDSLMDFNWKNKECFDAVGVYGTNTLSWHVKILNGEVVAIGRLQYELDTAIKDYVTQSCFVLKGQKVVSVHIPSSGKLDYEEVRKSYIKANDYFKGILKEVIFYCSSWLLWVGHKEMLGENSNIVKFSSDYELFEYGVYEFDQGLRRVFPKDYLKPYSELPENNSMQKAYKKLLLDGKKAGFGSGLMKL